MLTQQLLADMRAKAKVRINLPEDGSQPNEPAASGTDAPIIDPGLGASTE